MALNKHHMHGKVELEHILSKKNLRGAIVTIFYSYKQEMKVKFWLLVYMFTI